MRSTKRIVSVFLLAVYLLAAFAASFHHHPVLPDEPKCEQCAQHVPHHGHLVPIDGGLSNCLLCHFLGLPYVLAMAALLLPPTRLLSGIISNLQQAVFSAHLLDTRSRAPPVFCFA
ncbi:MAG: hypothetical protein K6F21_02455 [Bacteroidales bacterium]|nr:hypothetical protein [Bacteroidales bacterium]